MPGAFQRLGLIIENKSYVCLMVLQKRRKRPQRPFSSSEIQFAARVFYRYVLYAFP